MINIELNNQKFLVRPFSLGSLDKVDSFLHSDILAAAAEAAKLIPSADLRAEMFAAATAQCLEVSIANPKYRGLIKSLKGLSAVLAATSTKEDGTPVTREEARQILSDPLSLEKFKAASGVANPVSPTNSEKTERRESTSSTQETE